MNKYKRRLFRKLVPIKQRLSRIHLRDGQTPLWLVLKKLIEEIDKDDLGPSANAVAFSFTLSVFPSIIFLFTLIPYIPVEHLDTQILELMGQVLPASVYKELSATIIDIVSRPRSGLLSLGFVLAFYAATNGMMSLMGAFNRAYRTIDRRSFLKTRLIATGLTGLLVFALVMAVVVVIIGNVVLKWLVNHDAWGLLNDDVSLFLISGLQYGVTFALFFVAISIIYYWGPAIHKRWRFFSTGSVTAAVLCILVTHFFSYYISNFASYNRLYGSIGTLIGLMLWFFLLSFIILLGFEINACIDEVQRDIHAKIKRRERKTQST
ncbi:YihY/virulence factor BrkB family protein [Xanthocytophaga flava]|uniref:YihY/virulence factor BrkB family protein n=1 Tax=Xanthocytophaga flava TaxID=3048013 RepID=UPI0028D7E0A3|nr:YihY/virulence factor BrkB family protein [Xanthocytophaga flavus]MDJ1473542.1 YihY/virulence factor BrkB family protein [Xanthocytophaga flavus]